MSSYSLGTASGKIEIDSSGASKGFQAAAVSGKAFMAVITGKVADVETFGKRLAAVGGAATAGIGLAIKTASDFATEMSAVRAVTGGTQQDFEDLRQKALQLGKDTVFSSSEAAQAIEELAKAGIPVKDILNGAADATVALAAAGGVDLPTAATIASNAINQFGISAKELPKVADVLAGVANTSASDVAGIGESLSQAGAVAHLAGLDFKDTAIAIGELADAGITGSDAGTSLKTMLTNLIPSTNQQIQKFQELGLLTYNLADANKTLAKVTGGPAQKSIAGVNAELAKYIESEGKGTVGSVKNATAVQKLEMQYGGLKNAFFDAQGNAKSLEGIQNVLGKSTENMTKQQKLAALQILFGTDAMRASAILAEKGKKGYDDFAAAVAKTKASDVAKTRLDNLSGSVQQLQGSLETAEITIGTIFLPILKRIIDVGTKVVNFFNNLPAPIQKAIGITIAFVGVLSLLIGLFLASLTAIAAFVAQFFLMRIIKIAAGYLITFTKEMRAGAAATDAFSAANARAAIQIRRTTLLAKLGGKAMLLFGRAAKLAGALLKFAFSPIGLIIIAIVVALVLLYKHFKPFRDLVNSLASAIKNGLVKAWGYLKTAFAQGLVVLKQVGKQISAVLMPVLKQVGNALKGQFFAALKEIWATVQAQLLPALSQLGAQLKSNIVPAFTKVSSAIKPLIPTIIKVGTVVGTFLIAYFKTMAKLYLGVVLPALIKVVGFLAGQGIQAFVRFALGVIQAVTGIVKIITGFVKIVKGIFSGNWSEVIAGAGEVFSGLKDLIAGALKATFAVVIQWASTLGKLILSGLSSIFGSANGATGGYLGKFVNVFVVAFNVLKTVVSTAFKVVSVLFTTYITVITAIWSAFWAVFGVPIKAAFTVIVAIVGLIWATIKLIVLAGILAVLVVLKVQFAAIKAITQTAWNVISKVIGVAFKAAKAVVSAVVGAIKAVVSAAWGAIKGATSAAWGAIRGVVSSAASAVLNAVKGAFNKLKGVVSAAWDAVNKVTGGKIGEFITKIKEIGGKVLGAVSGFGTLLIHAGEELMSGLAQGVSNAIHKVTDQINKLSGLIKDHLPGSPVKTGPLTAWNRGAAGKKLMGLLAEGLQDTTEIDKAMKNVTTYINGAAIQMKPMVNTNALLAQKPLGMSTSDFVFAKQPVRQTQIKQPSRAKAGGLDVSGTLTLKDGKAYIKGIAEEVVDKSEATSARRGMM